MKLLSATVRNYRIHRDVTVNFDPSRTLVGGANETGKSTLIEAIHRGLFLKANVTGEAQKSMVSTLYNAHPEVEIHFTAQGAEYLIKKRFSGANGKTQLIQVGGTSWQGEQAEARLNALLNVTDVGGSRGILDRVSGQWSHLWVWQGQSGDDPSSHTAGQQAQLLQQLQHSGGAVAMQSELDGKVALHFGETRGQIFVRSGSAKSGSDLDRAQTEAEQARVDHVAVLGRLESLGQAIRDFEGASVTIERTTSDLAKLAVLMEQVDAKISQADGFRRVEERQASELKEATEKLAALEKVEQNICDLQKAVSSLQNTLTPKQEEEARLIVALGESRERTAEAERKYDESLKNTRVVRLRRELAVACVGWFAKDDRNRELTSRLERAKALEKEIGLYREKLSQLVAIDRTGLTALQTLERKQEQATAAMNAMAAEVEVVACSQTVRVGETELSVGARRMVTEATEVTVGDVLCMRIHPGGGDSLAKAREEVRLAKDKLQRSLDKYGLESVAKAVEVVAIRAEWEGKASKAEAALEELDADALTEACAAAKDELTAAETEVARRMEQVGNAEQPASLTDAKAWLLREDKALHDIESDETGAKAIRDVLLAEQNRRAIGLKAQQDAIAADAKMLTGFAAQLRMLLENYGVDDARAKTLEGARTAWQGASGSLSQTQAALAALQPDQLVLDRDRLQRAWPAKEQERQDAEKRRAVSQAALRSDGAEDPHAALAQAEAKRASAAEHLSAVTRKAQAIALIDELFQQEQRALADLFSQPLAEKIGDYLKRLFGPEARAVVTFEDNAFKSIKLVRSTQGGATPFDSLSGGTREQVAAAVRLAIAELLAADHGGSLPIVFDDAFAYSDPDRVNTMQGMLDLGASRGLQVIVLSCNPSDYAGLGARSVMISV